MPKGMTREARAYLEAALFASSDDEDVPLDRNYTVHDFAPSAVAQAERDIEAFVRRAGGLIAASPGGNAKRAMHDFWLTRNGHGAGFWDRPEVWGDDGAEELTEIAKSFREVNPYVGDDGKIHF